jgi:hypothetical protein
MPIRNTARGGKPISTATRQPGRRDEAGRILHWLVCPSQPPKFADHEKPTGRAGFDQHLIQRKA